MRPLGRGNEPLPKLYESTDPFQNAPPRVGIYPGAPLTAMGTVRLEF